MIDTPGGLPRSLPAGGFGWTEERIAVLTKLWIEGLSASQIAKQLRNVSRNAVIGKVHRLGLTARVSHNTRATQRLEGLLSMGALRPRNPPRPSAAIRAAWGKPESASRPPRATAAPIIHDTPHAKPWMLREPGQCTWPIGEGEGLLSCCAPISNGSWCSFHAKMGGQPATGSLNITERTLRRCFA